MSVFLAAADPNLTMVYLYKLVVVFLGAGSIFLGYRLFMKGFTAPAGKIAVGDGRRNFEMSKVAPGIFFALFGAVVIIVGVTRPFSFDTDDGGGTQPAATDTTGQHRSSATLDSVKHTDEEQAPTSPIPQPHISICDTCPTTAQPPGPSSVPHHVVLCDTCPS